MEQYRDHTVYFRVLLCITKRHNIKTGQIVVLKSCKNGQNSPKMAVLVVFWGYFLQFFVKKCAKMVFAALVQFRFVNWQPQATRLRWSQWLVVVGFRGPAQYFFKKILNLIGGTLGKFGSNDVFWMTKS